ncbi:uncharacterized protein LOC142336276 isoform X2 [Convolutriloba macropyga]|uniref:uncharacterized protein LOC142336276 isoform X2 n=1 Tax=Convolutriloba macropyga TaxID=536237 RepID=UPI003F524F03
MPLATRLYVTRHSTEQHKRQHRRKQEQQQRKRVSCDCNRSLLLSILIAFLLISSGIAMCFIAYHASSSIMGLSTKDMRPEDAKSQLSRGENRLYRLLYNLRIIGPIFMGTGAFILLCCVVVAYRDDKEKKDESEQLVNRLTDKNTPPCDIYDLAIRKYLQIDEERLRKRTAAAAAATANTDKKEGSPRSNDKSPRNQSNGSPKSSPGPPTDRSNHTNHSGGSEESRKGSLKSLENALIRIGGLVPQGLFSRRPSEAASIQTHTALLNDGPEEIRAHQVVDMSNYPVRTSAHPHNPNERMGRSDTNTHDSRLQKYSSSDSSNDSTPKRAAEPQPHYIHSERSDMSGGPETGVTIPGHPEPLPGTTPVPKSPPKASRKKSGAGTGGGLEESKGNQRNRRSTRRSVPLLVINDGQDSLSTGGGDIATPTGGENQGSNRAEDITTNGETVIANGSLLSSQTRGVPQGSPKTPLTEVSE